MQSIGEILSDIQERSGLSLAEIEKQSQERHYRTLNRLNGSGLPSPFPLIVPANSKRVEASALCQTWKVSTGQGFGSRPLLVILSICLESDDLLWYHASFSRADRLPDYQDIQLVRNCFTPDNLPAYQVFPPRSQYVNDHPYCLHLWVPMEGQGLPDFRKAGTI